MRQPGALLFSVFMLHAAAAAAQGLNDPTRPPPGWLPSDPRLPTSVKAAEPGGAPVQLVLVGPTRRFAIVRGELVGDKGSTRIVDVKRNDLVVQTDRGRETFSLFPDVQKTEPRKRPGLGEKEQK